MNIVILDQWFFDFVSEYVVVLSFSCFEYMYLLLVKLNNVSFEAIFDLTSKLFVSVL